MNKLREEIDWKARAQLAEARLRNVPALTPFNDAEDAAWPLALARLQNMEPGPDQGCAVVGVHDLELALRRLSQFAQVALGNAAVISDMEAAAWNRRADPLVEELRGALKAAERFIANGIEYGYIRMPDAGTPDSAHDTLPLIREALALPVGNISACTDSAGDEPDGSFASDSPCQSEGGAS